MSETLNKLIDSPIPKFLIIIGILLVIVGIVKNIGKYISLNKSQGTSLKIFGIVLLMTGIFFQFFFNTSSTSTQCKVKDQLNTAISKIDKYSLDNELDDNSSLKLNILKYTFRGYLDNPNFCQNSEAVSRANEELQLLENIIN